MYPIWNILVGFSVCFVISESVKENEFCIESGKTISDSTALMNTVVVDFYIECAIVCGSDLGCSYGVFRPDAKTCWLYSAHEAVLSASLTDTVILNRRKELRRHSVSSFRLFKPDLDTLDLHYFVFEVKACAAVYLDFLRQNSWPFSVYLGNTDLTKASINIVNDGLVFFDLDTPFNDCSLYKAFWVRWDSATVEVGTGNVVGANRLYLHTTTINPMIDNVEFFLDGPTDWIFVSQLKCG